VTLDTLTALDSATTAFRRLLVLVAEDDWTARTPCPDWDVHYLVAHVVGGNRFASLVLDGHTSEQAVAAVMSATQLSADPVTDFDDSAAGQRARFRRDGALTRNVGHPLGDLPGRRLLGLRVFDLAVHSWDLATAVGLDGTLDEALTESVLAIMGGEVPGLRFGIRPRGEAGPDAAPMERLLDLAGRSPR
jgi:uncharacterized protein (TIGR03086 family)